MRRLDKDSAWIFEMAVKSSRSEANKIGDIIEDSNGVILGRRSSDDIIKLRADSRLELSLVYQRSETTCQVSWKI